MEEEHLQGEWLVVAVVCQQEGIREEMSVRAEFQVGLPRRDRRWLVVEMPLMAQSQAAWCRFFVHHLQFSHLAERR